LIDFNQEIKNIQPINVESKELNNSEINDNIRKSIKLYNKSIIEIKTNDIDLAVNDLKKALHLNPDFSEAIKLLGLCYVQIKQYKKAEKVFRKLSKYEIYDGLVEEYLKNLIIEKTVAKTMDNIKRVNSGNNRSMKYVPDGKLRKKLIIGLAAIIIVVVGFTAARQIELIPQNHVEIADVEQNETPAEESTISNETYNEIEQRLKETEKKLSETESELEFYKNKYALLSKINEAEAYFIDGAYEEAAGVLLDMKSMSFDDETKIAFDKLWTSIRKKSMWNIYNQGNKLYNAGKYQEAFPKLRIAYEFEPSPGLMPWVTYQLGMCYKEANDYNNALILFQEVKDKYPKSKYAAKAEKMINQLKNE